MKFKLTQISTPFFNLEDGRHSRMWRMAPLKPPNQWTRTEAAPPDLLQ